MGSPLEHSVSAARKFGGVPADYIRIHQIMDSSKRYLGDWRHRALLHNTFGIHLMEEHIIGPIFTRESDGVQLDTRTLVSEHIKEDLAGVIPTPAEFLREMPISYWMSGVDKKARQRLKTTTISGSEEPPVVFERIAWHNTEETLPDKDGTYLISPVQPPFKELMYTLKDGWILEPDNDGRTCIPPKYWAEYPIGPF